VEDTLGSKHNRCRIIIKILKEILNILIKLKIKTVIITKTH